MDQSSPSEGKSNLSLALEALGNGQVDQAIQLLQFAATMNPSNAEAHFHLGRAYVAKESVALAEASLRRAVALSPEHAAALCELGKILARQQRKEEARRALESALQADPQCAEACEALEPLARPEDHAVLASLIEGIPVSAILSSHESHKPHRLLVVTGAMGVVLALLLALAFVQVRQLAVPGTPGGGAPSKGAAWGTKPPASPAESTTPEAASEAAAQPGTGGTPEAAPEAASQPEAAGASAGSEGEAATAPVPATVESYLKRIFGAQQTFHERNARYASLAELERLGVLSPGCASGQPVAECAGAVLDEDPPAEDAFVVRAALPDGTAVQVDQEGSIQAP